MLANHFLGHLSVNRFLYQSVWWSICLIAGQWTMCLKKMKKINMTSYCLYAPGDNMGVKLHIYLLEWFKIQAISAIRQRLLKRMNIYTFFFALYLSLSCNLMKERVPLLTLICCIYKILIKLYYFLEFTLFLELNTKRVDHYNNVSINFV